MQVDVVAFRESFSIPMIVLYENNQSYFSS